MRGNIGSELEALMLASGQKILAFIPAFPKLGRTTREGGQFIDGKPLHETGFASDPLDPVAGSFIPAIIESQTRILARIIGKTEMLHPASVKFEDEGIYVFDATTDDDLQLAGALLQEHGLLQATAGSSGFAEFLPCLLDFARRKSKPVYKRGRMLAVSGSVNEVSLRQTVNAEAQGFVCVTLSAEMLLAEDAIQSIQTQQAIAQIVELDRLGREVILRSAEKPEDLELCLALAQKRGLDLKQIHHRIAQNMGAMTRCVLKQTGFSLLTVFGGDTLLAIARVCGWAALLPQEDVLPGVVVSRVAGDVDAPLLITKAGGFGPVDVLVRIKEILRSRD